jgi:tetratricopeptide (TPR) repeat protein
MNRPAKARQRRTSLWLGVAIVVLTAAVYWPVRGYDFVSVDDPIYATDNPFLRGGVTWSSVPGTLTSTYAHFWHPLTLLSLMADVSVFGLHSGPLHVTNLLLHLCSVSVLFLALLRMTGAAGRSAFVAALFALHPLHVESVAWIAERKDVLSTVFWMLTLWAWAGYARSGKQRTYWVALAFFALGLMAKPMLVTLPVTLLLLDVWPLGRVAPHGFRAAGGRTGLLRAWWPLVREKIPFFALAAAAGVVAVLAQGSAVASLEAIPVWTRAATALVAYLTYIGKMIWPIGLTVFYPLPTSVPIWLAVGALAVLAGITVVVIRLRRRQPFLAVGWVWYVVTLLPVSGIVQVGTHAMADRYTYVPLVGLFVMVAWGVPALVGAGRARQWALGGIGAVVVLACAVSARAQVATWADSGALWQHALEVTPDNYYAHHAMATLLREQGRNTEAVAHLNESIRLNPSFPDARNNLGMALEALGRRDEAMVQYAEALRIDPGMPDANNNLGAVLLKLGRADEAIPRFVEALRRLPDSFIARDNLGQALAERGRYTEAEVDYTEALRLRPEFSAAHAHMGAALSNQGRLTEAVAEYREALRLEPAVADTHNNLGVVLGALGRTDEAAAEFQEALRLDPGHVLAHVNLGFALAGHGRAAEAIPHLAEAIRLQPNLELAHLYLGWALGGTGRSAEAAEQFREVIRINPNNQSAQRALDVLAKRVR